MYDQMGTFGMGSGMLVVILVLLALGFIIGYFVGRSR